MHGLTAETALAEQALLAGHALASLCALPTDAALSLHGDLEFRQAVTGVLALASFALGLAITYIAFQGYRRNRSVPMLYIAVGFGLIFLVEAVFAVLVYVVGVDIDTFTLQTVIQCTNLLGFGAILYALRMNV